MVVNGDSITNVLSSLPAELVSKLDFLSVMVKAIGGLFVLYLVFFAIRTYFLREQTKTIKEIKKDVDFIKKFLNKERKK